MQLMCRHSEEGQVGCLEIFDVPVLKFSTGCKVPHMGWNTVRDVKEPLFSAEQENDYLYYVHSFYAPVCAETMAVSEYGTVFSAALRKDNFYAVQFHPEKSGPAGKRILENFLSL